jgi:hypothetical protein
MLSDTDAKKRAADVEEGEIGEGSSATATEESGEDLAEVKASLQDLVKPSTCFMGRSLMTKLTWMLCDWKATLNLAAADCPAEKPL